MNTEYDLKKLEDIVNKYIDDKIIAEKKISQFSLPGENYGGVLLRADLILKNRGDEGKPVDDELSLVIKTIPPTEYLQILFNTDVSFKVEIAFYEVIVPTINEFEKKYAGKANNLFPKYYGGRISLNENSDRVDSDAMIALENLQTEGYINIDRFQGCDLQTARMILRNLAEFHTIPLAIKIKEPKLFENRIKPYFSCYYQKSNIPTVPTTGMMDILCEKESLKYLYPKVLQSLLKIYEFAAEFREPFFTLVHRDLWINNILVKYSEGEQTKVKFIDFQKYSYDSPAKDIIYFLLTSVPFKLLKPNFDDFLKYYHECFIEYMEMFGCDIKPFSYAEFIKEVGLCIEEELGHTLFMMLFVANGRGGGHEKVNGKIVWDNKNNVPPEGRQKFWWFIQECVDRKWI